MQFGLKLNCSNTVKYIFLGMAENAQMVQNVIFSKLVKELVQLFGELEVVTGRTVHFQTKLHNSEATLFKYGKIHFP